MEGAHKAGAVAVCGGARFPRAGGAAALRSGTALFRPPLPVCHGGAVHFLSAGAFCTAWAPRCGVVRACADRCAFTGLFPVYRVGDNGHSRLACGENRRTGERGHRARRGRERRNAVAHTAHAHRRRGGVSGGAPRRAGGPLRRTGAGRGHHRGRVYAPRAGAPRRGREPAVPGGALHQHAGEPALLAGDTRGAGR